MSRQTSNVQRVKPIQDLPIQDFIIYANHDPKRTARLIYNVFDGIRRRGDFGSFAIDYLRNEAETEVGVRVRLPISAEGINKLLEGSYINVKPSGYKIISVAEEREELIRQLSDSVDNNGSLESRLTEANNQIEALRKLKSDGVKDVNVDEYISNIEILENLLHGSLTAFANALDVGAPKSLLYQNQNKFAEYVRIIKENILNARGRSSKLNLELIEKIEEISRIEAENRELKTNLFGLDERYSLLHTVYLDFITELRSMDIAVSERSDGLIIPDYEAIRKIADDAKSFRIRRLDFERERASDRRKIVLLEEKLRDLERKNLSLISEYNDASVNSHRLSSQIDESKRANELREIELKRLYDLVGTDDLHEIFGKYTAALDMIRSLEERAKELNESSPEEHFVRGFQIMEATNMGEAIGIFSSLPPDSIPDLEILVFPKHDYVIDKVKSDLNNLMVKTDGIGNLNELLAIINKRNVPFEMVDGYREEHFEYLKAEAILKQYKGTYSELSDEQILIDEARETVRIFGSAKTQHERFKRAVPDLLQRIGSISEEYEKAEHKNSNLFKKIKGLFDETKLRCLMYGVNEENNYRASFLLLPKFNDLTSLFGLQICKTFRNALIPYGRPNKPITIAQLFGSLRFDVNYASRSTLNENGLKELGYVVENQFGKSLLSYMGMKIDLTLLGEVEGK